jgi:hypothetical protein
MNLSVTTAAILILGVAASVAGVVLVRRRIPQEKLEENNDYVGFTFSILSLIYGIYLAFTVVVVWQQFEDAEQTVSQEVVLLNAIWRDLAPFAPADQMRLRRGLMDYVRSVINDEWPRMANGLEDAHSEVYDALWDDFYRLNPDPNDVRQTTFYQDCIERMNDFAMARRMRILSSTAALPWSMWVLLVAGAVGTIGFTWFHGTRYMSMQLGVTAFLSAVIIYSVLLVAMLEHPFGGAVAVKPVPFQKLLEQFEGEIKERSAPVPNTR